MKKILFVIAVLFVMSCNNTIENSNDVSVIDTCKKDTVKVVNSTDTLKTDSIKMEVKK